MRGITSASTLISILELALLSAERSTHLKENSPALAKLREGVAAAVEELAVSVQIEAESDGTNRRPAKSEREEGGTRPRSFDGV